MPKITFDNDLKDIVTPKHLKRLPIHNWLIFPHSYSAELIEKLKNKWQLSQQDTIIDPFCGAGTTLLAAKQLGIPARGYDISPYAVFISNAKTANYCVNDLKEAWEEIKSRLTKNKSATIKKYPELVLKALSREVLLQYEQIERTIRNSVESKIALNFFRLGLFSIMPMFSRAQAAGGWLKWGPQKLSPSELFHCYASKIDTMIEQLTPFEDSRLENTASICDVRKLPEENSSVAAIICSPPYPNRHDYTRVFGIELMYGFLNWEETREVRYQSIHSHPESKPTRPDHSNYTPPKQLQLELDAYKKTATNKRLLLMLEGYFIDLYCSIMEMHRICKFGANVALVLGNVQYNGVSFLVDEITAEICEQIGFCCEEIITARLRGNSAQQMKLFGKRPSRESIILLKKN